MSKKIPSEKSFTGLFRITQSFRYILKQKLFRTPRFPKFSQFSPRFPQILPNFPKFTNISQIKNMICPSLRPHQIRASSLGCTESVQSDVLNLSVANITSRRRTFMFYHGSAAVASDVSICSVFQRPFRD
jgi:hypothetical protein